MTSNAARSSSSPAGPGPSSPFIPEPPMSLDTVYLHRDSQTLEVSLSSITPQMIARAFNLDVSTVWLKEQGGQRAFFPTGNSFHLCSDVPSLIYAFNVEGTSVTGSASSSGTVSYPTAPTPYRRPFTAAAKNQSVTVKIIQAKMSKIKGKPEFNNISLEYVEVTEATANVNYLSNTVQNKWGNDYILVSSDGLQLEDSSATQGLKFWKVGSRKIFAIRRSDLKSTSNRKRKDRSFENSDDETQGAAQMLKEVKADVSSLLQMKIPIRLRSCLLESFTCHICQMSPLKPPAMFCKSCRYIIGCQSCVDQWYTGDSAQDRTCPRCRAERGSSETCRMNGLDELLTTIRPLVCGSDEDED